MPRCLLLFVALLGGAVASAELPTTIPLKADAVSQPQLPLAIPGYQLRVLDAPKPVIVSVGGEKVEASIPIFFYFPVPEQPQARVLVEKAYGDLTGFKRKEQWTGAELQQVLRALDQALKLLVPPAPSSSLANEAVPPGGPGGPALPKIIPPAMP